MLRQAVVVAFFLSLSSSSFAGVAIILVPSGPIPPAGYEPGDQFNIDIFAQLTPGTPSVPGPGGTTTAIRVRRMQFDLSDSDAALGVSAAINHPTADPDSDGTPNPVPFWDFSGVSACSADPTSCGINYFIDGHIDASDNILTITHAGLTGGGNYITLNQTVPKRIGGLVVTYPHAPGTYVLDVLNADDPDPTHGAEIRWGIGSTADPVDPTSPVRANTGGITGGRICLGPLCIPEPGTLALLGLGGLAVGTSRRRYS